MNICDFKGKLYEAGTLNLNEAGVTANRRWWLVSADSGWRAIPKFDWQLGRYEPSFPSYGWGKKNNKYFKKLKID